jgi:phage tail-like protein
MAVLRDRPYCQFNFLVDLGDGNTDGPRAGFQEVSAISTEVAVAEYRNGNSKENSPIKITGLNKATDVTMKRGIIGALDLYDWWDQARRGKAPPRRVMSVKLLAEDRATVVWTWRFRNVRPVSLSYSPLRGIEGGVLMETIELAYDDVAMA